MYKPMGAHVSNRESLHARLCKVLSIHLQQGHTKRMTTAFVAHYRQPELAWLFFVGFTGQDERCVGCHFFIDRQLKEFT